MDENSINNTEVSLSQVDHIFGHLFERRINNPHFEITWAGFVFAIEATFK